MLSHVAGKYGEDSIREFVRMTLLKDRTPVEAATMIFGDGAVGQQLEIAVSHIVHEVE